MTGDMNPWSLLSPVGQGRRGRLAPKLGLPAAGNVP